MKKSEKLLLTVFSFMCLIIVGGGAIKHAYSNYRDICEENQSLADQIANMEHTISTGAEWAEKYGWIEEHIPVFATHQEASSKLLSVITARAEKRGISIGAKEFVDEAREMGPDGQPLDGKQGYFDCARVKITLTGAMEKVFFEWLEDIQQAKLFIGVTHILINPTGTNKTVNCEVEFTQFFREDTAAK